MRYLLVAIVVFLSGGWLCAQPLPKAKEASLLEGGSLSTPNVLDSELKLENINHLIQEAPDNPELVLRKGVYLFDLGRSAEAIEIFDALRLKYPENVTPYVNLAAVYASIGRLEDARQMLLKADSLSPDKYQSRMSLASIHVVMALTALQSIDGGTDSVAGRKIREVEKLLSSITELPINLGSSGQQSANVPLRLPSATGLPGPVTPLRTIRSETKPVRTQSVDRLALGSPSASIDALPISAKSLRGSFESFKKGAAEWHDEGLRVEERATASKTDVLNSVESWASAWSRRDLVDYISHYSLNFKVPNGTSRDDWVQQRRRVFEKTKSIRVDVKIRQIKMRRNTASVIIIQRYSSDIYSDVVRKELKFEQELDKWKIISEKRV